MCLLRTVGLEFLIEQSYDMTEDVCKLELELHKSEIQTLYFSVQ